MYWRISTLYSIKWFIKDKGEVKYNLYEILCFEAAVKMEVIAHFAEELYDERESVM